MLQTLPKEVLRAITDNLGFIDRLNMCKTCSKLHESISRTNLYETLIVRKNTEDIIQMFQDRILDGTQVQVLEIKMDDLSDELYSRLSEIFPNVLLVKTQYNQSLNYLSERKIREEYIISPLLKWKDSIKRYNSHYDWKYFKNELFRSVFPRLEDLTLSEVYLITGQETGFYPASMSNDIINAPMLTRLNLEKCEIGIDSLEKIHHGCPYIRTLRFADMNFIEDKDTLPLSIIPADSVLRLEINFISFDIHGLYLEYILRKYPDLQYLTIYLLEYDDNKGNCETYQNRSNGFRSTLKVYKNGASAFISRLPKSIKSIALGLEIFGNSIDTLSERDFNLSSLKLDSIHDRYLSVESDQLEYIKNFESLKSLIIQMSFSSQTYQMDYVSDTITTLNITPMSGAPSIIWITSVFPSLESLTIEFDPDMTSENYTSVGKNADYTTCTRKTYPKLRMLDLEARTIDLESFNIIKTIFPNLKELSCEILNQDKDMDYTLDVTCWNLDDFDVWVSLSQHLLDRYIVITSPEKSLEFLKKYSTKDLIPVKYEPDSVEGVTRIDIICNHINNFSVNGQKIHI